MASGNVVAENAGGGVIVMDNDAVSFLSASEVAVTVAVPFCDTPAGFTLLLSLALAINPASAPYTTELEVCPLSEPLPVEIQVTPWLCLSWATAAWMVRVWPWSMV